MDIDRDTILSEIQQYLCSGGMFNPELAIHDNVRDLIIKCKTYIINNHEKSNTYCSCEKNTNVVEIVR
jgi:hypothetical protein